MAGIYVDQHCDLSELLKRANNDQGPTLLIPDLQRPYVWSPRQVILLMDSLIRGWPFGTFLTWKVQHPDPVCALARPFWHIVDRTDGDDAVAPVPRQAPATFQMVLDGQQRIQSLLLAVGGDGWGFKMYDRDWTATLTGEKPRGRIGTDHWSLGSLCLDLDALLTGYAKAKRAAALDFSEILLWAVTGGATAQSTFPKKQNYKEPLSKADEGTSRRFIRLSRVWDVAPTVEIEADQAEEKAAEFLLSQEVSPEVVKNAQRAVGSLLMVLGRVKKTRVTYLELAEFDQNVFTRENYNDAVVNIFTRLNTAGRTLTREDITFAWLKTGWLPEKTDNQSPTKCFDLLGESLKQENLDLSIEQLVAGISFVWSSNQEGRLLTNNDLLKGDAIRPMASGLSNNWSIVTAAIIRASLVIREHGFRFHEHYESLNSVFILWAWQYIADQWLEAHPLKEKEEDSFEKATAAVLKDYVDRWIMSSQWAGRWAIASAETIAGYAKRLHECAQAVNSSKDAKDAIANLRAFLQNEATDLQKDATAGLQSLHAGKRDLVRIYYAHLWIWHRLDDVRWKMSQIPLKTKSRKKVSLHVDHTVAYAFWKRKLVESGLPKDSPELEEELATANELGNCSLLEGNFNLSKSDATLKSFLEDVYEFKMGKVTLKDWAAALKLPSTMLEPDTAEIAVVKKDINDRDQLIRTELADFIAGKRSRVDL